MLSKRSLEGEVVVDLRHAPGPSLDEITRSGKSVIGAGVKGLFEAPTLTCCHCQTQVLVNPMRTRDRNFCRKCDRYVCDNPGCNAECNGSFKAILDAAQEAAFRGVNP